jgi:branched-chain amino acid transport system ATP-binding protein
MLECDRLHTYYGAAHVLFAVSLKVAPGTAACILGRNGVGKSTTLRTVMGLTPPREGSILFKGRRIDGLPAYKVARMGLGYVPEERRVFAERSVEDNQLVAERQAEGGFGWTAERAFEVFPALQEFRTRLAGFLSGGQQQMLTIARALMGNPSMLLLDEPTEGLSPVMVKTLEEAILSLKREGLTMLVAAQDMHFAAKVADHLYVMNRGAIVYEGPRADMERDAAVIQSHLVV